ncbi:MAG: cell wall hydrolase [Firmicutes bacterium HGW-Firmicutes-21]|nr:MAG: cell wall hydrolase [Firmicutes bacterium HGW-Firmicutes-21]
MVIKIFIDQEYNPTDYFDSGPVAFGVSAQEVNWQVGAFLATLLNTDPRFEVRLSRPTPETVVGTDTASSEAERVQMANDWPADYYIVINSSFSFLPEENGTEVYVFRLYTSPNWLAQNVLEGIVQNVGTKNNGVRENPFMYKLRYTKMPTIIVDLAYLTNAEDSIKLRNNQYQFASGIYIGFLKFIGYA